ncbi:diguanylate cyclase response regulator [Thalassotalea insulae]|uniref:diguanylate cyclase n=1 Tax=Thalassotalea insulae TaxID=2056778 RepID=A0ABQ6GWS9_9GAMM|nr:diguanylate cyclase [Thalassotalea insulae]GLX80385.1 diguanylate cyclase response regulator [Thalassotalea insulae]
MAELTDNQWHVLIVEDDDINFEVLKAMFNTENIIARSATGNDCISYCESRRPDIILMSISLPDITGLEICKILRSNKATADIIIVFITSNSDDETQLSCWNAGANDFVCKPVNLSTLKKRLEAQVKLFRQTQLFKELSHKDGLTGVFNRRYLDNELPKLLALANRNKIPFCVFMIDIDWFKLYNDCYGHLSGDSCLKKVALEISKHLNRGSDALCRYGGEEFVCLLPGTDTEGALKLANKLVKHIHSQLIEHKLSPLKYLSVSVGVAVTDVCENLNEKAWLTAADEALYQAKHKGRCSFAIKNLERING